MSEIKEQPVGGNQQPQEDKTSIHFDANMKKLVGVLGGKELLTKTSKVKKDVLSTIVENLLKERKEKLELDVKTDLSSLLEKHVTVTKAIVDKQKELKDLEVSKKKEFNDACNKLFSKVEDIEQLEKDYYASLSSIKKD